MRAVVQRSGAASVVVEEKVVGEITGGLVILLGVAPHDSSFEVDWMAEKIANLRIFSDQQGKMNLSLLDIGGEALVISQFTLYGDCRKGRRPHFMGAAKPDLAEPLYEEFCEKMQQIGVTKVAKGCFGANMKVSLINEGPVTLIVDSKVRT